MHRKAPTTWFILHCCVIAAWGADAMDWALQGDPSDQVVPRYAVAWLATLGLYVHDMWNDSPPRPLTRRHRTRR